MKEQIRIAAILVLSALAGIGAACIADAARGQDGGGPYPTPPVPPAWYGSPAGMPDEPIAETTETVVAERIIAEVGDGGDCTWWSVFWGSFWFWE